MFALRGLYRSPRRTGVAALSATVVLGLALGACGNGSETDSAARIRLIAATADKTSAATTAHMVMSTSFEGGSAGSSRTIEMDGAVDMRTGDASFRMSGDAFGVLQGKDAEIRIVDGVMYMGSEGLAAADPSLQGKEWIKFDMEALAAKLGTDVTSKAASNFDRPDPAATLAMLRGVSGEVDEVGHEKLRGVDTTHYRIEIDPKKALDTVDGLPDGQRDTARKAIEKLGDAKFPADVWIDAEGRLRKMSMTLDSGKLDLGKSVPGARATVTYELYDFGTPVKVTAPPPDKVLDISEMFSALGDAFGKIGEGLGGGSSQPSR